MTRSPLRRLALLVVLLAAAAALGLCCGGTFGWNPLLSEYRATRVVLAIIVGAGLATAGAVLQAITGNPLADPFILGSSSGASVGVVVAAWLGIGETSPLFFGCAIAGAFLAILLVLRIARIGRRMPVQTLLLAGITVSTLGSSIVLLHFSSDSRVARHQMLFLMGSLDESRWSFLLITGAIVATGIVVSLLSARALNAFAMGEATARHLGVDVERLKLLFCLVASAMIGAIVAASGLIGFVGLIVPHILRRLVGSDARRLLPACVLGGATFLILADVAARTVAAPERLSLGAITALCGGPFFLLLLRRRRFERDPAASAARVKEPTR